MAAEPRIRVAIIGAGIIGIVLAHALLERNIPVTIYEQSSEIRVTGGGINAIACGVKALKRCAKNCYEAFLEVKSTHHLERPELYWTIVEGDNVLEIETDEEYGSMPRRRFMEALVNRLPPGTIQFKKKLTKLDKQPLGPIQLNFSDASTQTVDVLFGCDGISSQVRGSVVPDADYNPSFSQMIICRALTPLSAIESLLGTDLAKGAHIELGHGEGHVWYPVDATAGNLGYFFKEDKAWPHAGPTTKWRREELLARMKALNASPATLAIGNLFPETVDVWGIMHMARPLPTYSAGNIAVLGDAAHASTPFLGAGAAQGYEDAAVCAELLQALARKRLEGAELYAALEAALRAYSDTRKERSQGVVRNSCWAGQVCMGAVPRGQAAAVYGKLTEEAWSGDVKETVALAMKQLEASL